MDLEEGIKKIQDALKKYGADNLAASLDNQAVINSLLGPDYEMESISDLLLANTQGLSEDEIREINSNLKQLFGPGNERNDEFPDG